MLWPLSVVLVANTDGRLAIPALAGLLVIACGRLIWLPVSFYCTIVSYRIAFSRFIFKPFLSMSCCHFTILSRRLSHKHIRPTNKISPAVGEAMYNKKSTGAGRCFLDVWNAIHSWSYLIITPWIHSLTVLMKRTSDFRRDWHKIHPLSYSLLLSLYFLLPFVRFGVLY